MNQSEPRLPFAKLHEIPRIQKISPEAFQENHFRKDVPVIVCGATGDWTFDRFARSYGARLVRSQIAVAKKSRGKESLGSLIEGLGAKSEEGRFYLQHPLDDEWRDRLVEDLYGNSWFPLPDTSYLWLGSANAGGVGLHQDDGYSNVLGQFIGEKHCILIHPKYTKLLSVISLYQPAETTFPFHFDSFRSNVTAYPSSLAPEHISWEHFDELRAVEAHVCRLGPGESLFIPTSWFHFVSSNENTLSLSLRWANKDWLCERRTFQLLLDLILTFLRHLPNDQRQSFASRLVAELQGEEYLTQPTILASPVRPPHLFGWEPIRDEALATIKKLADTLASASLNDRLPRAMFEKMAESQPSNIVLSSDPQDEFALALSAQVARRVTEIQPSSSETTDRSTEDLFRDVATHLQTLSECGSGSFQQFITKSSISIPELRSVLSGTRVAEGRTLEDLHRVLLIAANYH